MHLLSYFLFFTSLINFAKADEAAALCAFIEATNINSIYSEWSCENSENRCSWPGITCDGTGSISQINLGNFGFKLFFYIKYIILNIISII